jgi:hypothetical protein
MSEARTLRLEEDVRDIKAALVRLEPTIIRIDERLNTELPHLATKAELAALDGKLSAMLADKPSRGYLWLVFTALIAAYAAGLAVLAVAPHL